MICSCKPALKEQTVEIKNGQFKKAFPGADKVFTQNEACVFRCKYCDQKYVSVIFKKQKDLTITYQSITDTQFERIIVNPNEYKVMCQREGSMYIFNLAYS